jgi:hypothetical protein
VTVLERLDPRPEGTPNRGHTQQYPGPQVEPRTEGEETVSTNTVVTQERTPVLLLSGSDVVTTVGRIEELSFHTLIIHHPGTQRGILSRIVTN